MQPRAMELLEAVATAVSSELVLRDTHKSDYLKRPIAKIDCSGLASHLPEWTQLVTPFEFKLSCNDMHGLLGQLVERCQIMFSQQRMRRKAFAVGITSESVEVFSITRSAEDDKISIERTGPQPLVIHDSSSGMQWIARILQASLEDLGYTALTPPDPFQLGPYSIMSALLIAEGSAPESHGPASYVFQGHLREDEEMGIIKLHKSTHEV